MSSECAFTYFLYKQKVGPGKGNALKGDFYKYLINERRTDMDICFEGVGQVAATFQVEGEVQPGMTVTLTKSGCVGKGTDGKPPCGVVLGGVRCGSAAVQIGGTVKVGYTGAVPTAG